MESELLTCEFGYGKYLLVPFWHASAAYQAPLVSPWVVWLDCISSEHEPWFDQTRLNYAAKHTKKVRLGINDAHPWKIPRWIVLASVKKQGVESRYIEIVLSSLSDFFFKFNIILVFTAFT